MSTESNIVVKGLKLSQSAGSSSSLGSPLYLVVKARVARVVWCGCLPGFTHYKTVGSFPLPSPTQDDEGSRWEFGEPLRAPLPPTRREAKVLLQTSSGVTVTTFKVNLEDTNCRSRDGLGHLSLDPSLEVSAGPDSLVSWPNPTTEEEEGPEGVFPTQGNGWVEEEEEHEDVLPTQGSGWVEEEEPEGVLPTQGSGFQPAAAPPIEDWQTFRANRMREFRIYRQKRATWELYRFVWLLVNLALWALVIYVRCFTSGKLRSKGH